MPGYYSNQIALDAMRAKNLFNFVKRAREVFGESTLLVGSKQFDEVCKKYKLVKGLLKQYTGVIPDRNIREIICVPALCLWYSHSQYVGRRIRGQSV